VAALDAVANDRDDVAVRRKRDFDGAVALAERMLARDKCWEGAWRIMIEARREQGRPALAARALEQCAQALQDELGVQPSPETRALLGGRVSAKSSSLG
jgi:DNA-binding SARP family transcriptional activator